MRNTASPSRGIPTWISLSLLFSLPQLPALHTSLGQMFSNFTENLHQLQGLVYTLQPHPWGSDTGGLGWEPGMGISDKPPQWSFDAGVPWTKF